MHRLRRLLIALVALGLLAALALRSAVIVDETEYVLVTEFGRPVALYGDAQEEAGFHWKWPWQSSRTQGIPGTLAGKPPPARAS